MQEQLLQIKPFAARNQAHELISSGHIDLSFREQKVQFRIRGHLYGDDQLTEFYALCADVFDSLLPRLV